LTLSGQHERPGTFFNSSFSGVPRVIIVTRMMATNPQPGVPELMAGLGRAPVPDPSPQSLPAGWTKPIDRVIFVFLLLFAITLPFSVKGAHHALQAAALLWLATVIFGRKRILPQPLVAPMLVFLLLSGLSALLSPAPLYSWTRMKMVCLILVATLFAQTVRRLSELKAIAAVLVISAVASAGLTAWQMTAGIGVSIQSLPPQSPLAQAGLAPGDIIASLNGHSVRTPKAFRERLQQVPASGNVKLQVLRGNMDSGLERFSIDTNHDALVGSGLLAEGAVKRGHPLRAQGTFHHYAVYAELLVQLALLTWGLTIAAFRQHSKLSWLLLAASLATTGALAATKTRSSLGALLLAALAIACLTFGRRQRIAILAFFAVLVAVSTMWLYQTRGFWWVDLRDPGTQYRVALWQDGLRLARQHPWFGVGMDSVTVRGSAWQIQAYKTFHTQRHFHSDWVQLAAECGLPALAAFIWLIAAYFIFLLRRLRRTRSADWFAHGLTLGVFAGLLGFLIESFVQYNLGEEQVVVAFWALAGLSFALARLQTSPEAAPAA
jgi:O-antigen ligase